MVLFLLWEKGYSNIWQTSCAVPLNVTELRVPCASNVDTTWPCVRATAGKPAAAARFRGQRQYEARTQSSYGGWDPTTEAGHLRSAGIQVNGSFPCFGSSASRRAVPQ